jgi:hypothetical protein
MVFRIVLPAENESVIPLYDGYGYRRHLRVETHRIARLQVLPFRVNRLGIDDFTAYEILEPRVAVQSTAPLSDLDNPRPDAFGWRLDRDGAGGAGVGVRHKQVSWEAPGNFGRRGSPPQYPGAERQRVDCTSSETHSDKKITWSVSWTSGFIVT